VFVVALLVVPELWVVLPVFGEWVVACWDCCDGLLSRPLFAVSFLKNASHIAAQPIVTMIISQSTIQRMRRRTGCSLSSYITG
jgi:hypothetical protein